MRISAALQLLSVRKVRARLVANIVLTVQALALLGFIFSAIGTTVAEQPPIVMEFCLLGVCLISAVVLLANDFRHEAGTAIWLGSIAAMLVSFSLSGLSAFLMIVFGFACLWLVWYVTPTPQSEPE